jgi:hypothetical protein
VITRIGVGRAGVGPTALHLAEQARDTSASLEQGLSKTDDAAVRPDAGRPRGAAGGVSRRHGR